MNDIVHIDAERLRAQLEKKLPPRIRRFRLDDIPQVMRSRLGWPVAAALMQRWFEGMAFEMPQAMKASVPPYRLSQLGSLELDERAVSMSWALGFSRVHSALTKLQAGWASPAGMLLLQKRVSPHGGHPAQQPWRFGNLRQPAKVLDETCQVNFLTVGRLSDPMDDFYGAMGEATLKVAVSGMVMSKGPGKAAIDIDELGFYLRDSYDFNDDSPISQPLGFWGPQGVERNPRVALDIPLTEQWMYAGSAEGARQSYLVQNRHFRQWRTLHGRGRDFMVVSDVHHVRLPFPIKLEW